MPIGPAFPAFSMSSDPASPDSASRGPEADSPEVDSPEVDSPEANSPEADTDGCGFSTMRGKVVFGPTQKTKIEGRSNRQFHMGRWNSRALAWATPSLLPASENSSGRNRGRCGPVGPGAPFEELLDWMETQMYTIFGTVALLRPTHLEYRCGEQMALLRIC